MKNLQILIAAKQNRLGLKLAEKLGAKLGSFAEVSFDPTTAMKLSRLGKHGKKIRKFLGDFIITVGGDGTFLRTAYEAVVPILPVRIEGHGFLCTMDFKDLMRNLDKLEGREYFVTERLRLRCTKVSRGIFDRILSKPYPHSLNEIVFTRKRPSKVLHIEFIIDGIAFDFLGDGLMIASPYGSTAYNASAGGSILDPSLEAINIVPLYPFYSKVKPITVPADKKIEVKIASGDCTVIIDGHGGEYLKGDSDFIIEKGEPMKIINLQEGKFYERLKSELMK